MSNVLNLNQAIDLLNSESLDDNLEGIKYVIAVNKRTPVNDENKAYLLYILSRANLLIGNSDFAIKIIVKAESCCREYTQRIKERTGEPLVMHPFAKPIYELMKYLSNEFKKYDRDFLSSVAFDENTIDLRNLHGFANPESDEVREIDDEYLLTIFKKMTRSTKWKVYYDRSNNDIFQVVEGYKSSDLTNQVKENIVLKEKIKNGAPYDRVDFNICVEIPLLKYYEFFIEYLNCTEDESLMLAIKKFTDQFSEKFREQSPPSFGLFVEQVFTGHWQGFMAKWYEEQGLTAIHKPVFDLTRRRIALKWLANHS